jgi:hypothetical protein
MRQVILLERYRPEGRVRDAIRETDVTATFHAWGVEHEEYLDGPGNFSTAIVELEDGTVKNVPCDMVRFITKEDDAGSQRQE